MLQSLGVFFVFTKLLDVDCEMKILDFITGRVKVRARLFFLRYVVCTLGHRRMPNDK